MALRAVCWSPLVSGRKRATVDVPAAGWQAAQAASPIRPLKRARVVFANKVAAHSNMPGPTAPALSGEAAHLDFPAPATAEAPTGPAVRFRVPGCELQWGEHVRVVGAAPQLGAWQPSGGLELGWGEGHSWSAAAAEVAPGSQEFKLLIVRQDGSTYWEEGPNRTVAVPQLPAAAAGCATLDVCCRFGDPSATSAQLEVDRAQLQEVVGRAQQRVQAVVGHRSQLLARASSLQSDVHRTGYQIQSTAQALEQQLAQLAIAKQATARDEPAVAVAPAAGVPAALPASVAEAQAAALAAGAAVEHTADGSVRFSFSPTDLPSAFELARQRVLAKLPADVAGALQRRLQEMQGAAARQVAAVAQPAFLQPAQARSGGGRMFGARAAPLMSVLQVDGGSSSEEGSPSQSSDELASAPGEGPALTNPLQQALEPVLEQQVAAEGEAAALQSADLERIVAAELADARRASAELEAREQAAAKMASVPADAAGGRGDPLGPPPSRASAAALQAGARNGLFKRASMPAAAAVLAGASIYRLGSSVWGAGRELVPARGRGAADVAFWASFAGLVALPLLLR